MKSNDTNRTASESTTHKTGDTGPIPQPMLNDLRRLLWRMEHFPLYAAIAMGILIGGVWIAGIVFFITADHRHPHVDRTSMALGAASLSLLAALLYSPFISRWFDNWFDAKILREALYTQRLEDLSHFMAVCRMNERRTRLADALLTLWTRHGLEPAVSARPATPKPLFR